MGITSSLQNMSSRPSLASTHSKRNVAKINDVVGSVCDEYKLVRMTDIGAFEGRHVRDLLKWNLDVLEMKTSERATLELFQGPLRTGSECAMHMRGSLQHKWLEGEHFQAFNWYSFRKPDIHCFVYKNDDERVSVRDMVGRRHLAFGCRRERIIVGYLEDILSALIELNFRGLYHSKLGWDIFKVGTDNKVRLGKLEYVVDEKTARRSNHLTELRHAAPETLVSPIGQLQQRKAQRDLNRVQTWILGSLLLEIIQQKQISGPDFRVAKENLTRSSALMNIKTNTNKLVSVLCASDLSKMMKLLIFQMLEVNPEKRIGLAEALSHLGSDTERRSAGAGCNLQDPSAKEQGDRTSNDAILRPELKDEKLLQTCNEGKLLCNDIFAHADPQQMCDEEDGCGGQQPILEEPENDDKMKIIPSTHHEQESLIPMDMKSSVSKVKMVPSTFGHERTGRSSLVNHSSSAKELLKESVGQHDNMRMVSLSQGQGCTINLRPACQSGGANGRKVRITIKPDPENAK